jgi:hypothetical protein
MCCVSCCLVVDTSALKSVKSTLFITSLQFKDVLKHSTCTAPHRPIAVAVLKGVGLKPLDGWDRGFESCCGHGCSSLVFVACCVGSGVCDELVSHSEECYRVCICVCVCDFEASTMRRPRPRVGLSREPSIPL